MSYTKDILMEVALGAVIKGIEEGSIASMLGISAGDRLLKINGRKVADILDYEFYAGDEEIEIEIERAGGERQIIEIEKDAGEDLGFLFDQAVFNRMKKCANHCLFCFIDQLPPGLRRSLYFKDDDYRLSFLYGNFISLTNLTAADREKINRLRLSPLYVSVHSMVPAIRAELMGCERAAEIGTDINRLQAMGLQMHAQIVLCPGINDGASLEYSVEKLADLYPAVLSVGIVPVGLTEYSPHPDRIRPVSAGEAAALIEQAGRWQAKFRQQSGLGFVYLADEFYIKAGLDFPPGTYYDDYCQLENGIGFCRQLLDDFAGLEPELPDSVEPARKYFLVTGISSAGVMERLAGRLNRIPGLEIEILPVVNRFFGPRVTVTGLLTGRDILEQLGQEFAGRDILLPEVLLKENSDLFLDGMTVPELARLTGARFIIVDGSAAGLMEAVAGV